VERSLFAGHAGSLFLAVVRYLDGRHSLVHILGYGAIERLNAATFRLLAYTVIGGALGGIVNGIRSLLFWHSDKQAFSRRFAWKYLTFPFLGTTLALFVYAIIRSGMAAFGGDFAAQAAGTSQSFSALVVRALAGYGSRQVFIWLDARVKEFFKVEPLSAPADVAVPNLIGKTRKEAEDILKARNLKVGKVTEEATTDADKEGKVVKQTPTADSTMTSAGEVELIVAKKAS
jgi:PASTA domain